MVRISEFLNFDNDGSVFLVAGTAGCERAKNKDCGTFGSAGKCLRKCQGFNCKKFFCLPPTCSDNSRNGTSLVFSIAHRLNSYVLTNINTI